MLRPIVFFCAPLLISGTEDGQQNALNPVRKVVNMLQKMQKKVQEEGVEEKKLYDKFMCYCETGGGKLASSIDAAEEKIPAVSSSIEAAEAKLAGAKSMLKQAQTDRSAAKGSMADATALRKKEAAAFAALKADADANVAAIVKAVKALETGVAGSFLQTPAAVILRKMVSHGDLGDAEMGEVTAFLTQGSNYAPQSGEIIGILKQMGGSAAKALLDATNEEEAAIKAYKGLIAAKKKEVAALTATIESKTSQIGELGVSIVMMKEDVQDTTASLAEDKNFLGNLKKSCATKTAEWEERSKTRAEELVALGDTIKVLNDDDALELFKKTLPSASASLLQMQASTSEMRQKALSKVLQAKQSGNQQDRVRLELLAMALTGKRAGVQGGFGKVVKMIDDMVALLHKEQQDDNDKKEYCSTQFDLSDDKKKALERTSADEASAIATAKEGIATLKEEIAALEAGIKALDKAVADATAQRQLENAEYKSLVASDTAATEVLAFAKNRLNKFYNPKLYKPAPKTELSAEDRIYENEGGVISTTPAGGIAGTGITVFAQLTREAPEPPPETWDAYAKKSSGSTGVIAMIDLLIQDLTKELTEAEAEEKNAQAEYEQMMKDSAAKRVVDSQALTEKGSAKADMVGELESHTDGKAGADKELMATAKYIASLHGECDWLMQYFDVRKEARTGEIDSLSKAKDVLKGADYALAQVRTHRFLERNA